MCFFDVIIDVIFVFLSFSCWDVCITRKSGISCKMLLTIFGLLRSVKVICNSRTVFSLHLHKQIASQKEWTEILNLHFFQFIQSANRKIWSSVTSFIIMMIYTLVKTVTIVVTTTVSYSTICVYTSMVPVNMLQVYTLWCYYWSWYLARQGRQQISTTTTFGNRFHQR